MSWIVDLFSQDDNGVINTEEIRMQFLKGCVYNTVDFFSLNGWSGPAKIVKVYDGDTMTAILFVNNKPFKFRIRLADIDTAEKTSEDPQEQRWSDYAIDWCKEFIGADAIVHLRCKGMDKYGRVLATVYKNAEDSQSLNTILLGAGLAYEYNGGARRAFKDWALCEETADLPTLKEYINDSEVTERQD
jgi:endonuclease YncB( thermonuclease family)